MVHTLRLDNYYPTPQKLVLGTNSSFGTESIKICLLYTSDAADE